MNIGMFSCKDIPFKIRSLINKLILAQFAVVLLLLLVPHLCSCDDCDGISDSEKRTDEPPTSDATDATTTDEPVAEETTETSTTSTTTTTTTTTTPTTTSPTTTPSSSACESTTTTTCSSGESIENTEPTDTSKSAVQTLLTLNDCTSVSDGTFMVDGRHCRRYYVCSNGRAKRLRCSISQWFDRETLTCRDRQLVTNCPINRT